MILKSLTVKNFRGLRGEKNKICFENSNIIFLIGNNNSGKSTFLYAYQFFINPKSISKEEDFLDKDILIPIEIIAEFKREPISGKEYPDWINKYTDDDGIVRIKKIWRNVNDEAEKYTYAPECKDYIKGGFGGFDSFITQYSPIPIYVNAISTLEDLEKKINDIISKNHIKKLEIDYSQEYKLIIESLEQLKNKISQAEEIRNINNKVNELFKMIFPNLTINIYSKPDEGIDISKTLKSTHGFEIQDSANKIDLKNNGHGIIRQALFSFLSTNEIKSKENKYILLYEEPELYLHPEIINILKNELYNLSSKYGYQVLCATHSPSMIDLSKAHSSLVRLEKNKDSKETRTYQVEFDMFKEEERSEILMYNRFDPYLCHVFYAEEIIIVEGDTEALIYRELIEKFYSNRKHVYILNARSKSNIVFYQKILTHFGIKHVVIHDCDNKISCDGRNNPMWTVNEKIWEQIEESNKKYPNISRRFVHYKNFEEAHNYKFSKSEGKPYSAYKFAKAIDDIDPTLPCFEFLNDFYNENKINISQENLLKNN